jgi:hypothetical protein
MMPFNWIARVRNMTRETKLGLVVACSFLGLLGVVLGMKLTEPPEDQQGQEEAAAAPNEATPPAAAAQPAGEEQGKQSGWPSSMGTSAPPKAEEAPPRTKTPKSDEPPVLVPVAAKEIPTPLPPLGSAPASGSSGQSQNTTKPGDDGLPKIEVADTSPPKSAVSEQPVAKDKPTSGGQGRFWSSLWDKARGTSAAVVKSVPKKGPADDTTGNKPVAKADNSGLLPVLPPDGSKPSVPTTVPGSKGSDAPPLPSSGGMSGGNLPPVDLPPVGKPGEATSSAEGGKPGSRTLPALPPVPPLNDKKSDPPPPAPPPIDPPPAGGTGTSGTGGTSAPPPLRPTPTDLPPPAAPPEPAKPSGGSSTPLPPPAPAPAPPAPAKPADATPTFEVGGNTTGQKKPDTDTLPPVAAKPPVPAAAAPPMKEPEPIAVGTRPSAAVPALPVPSSPGVRTAQPDVVSYTEETYAANSGDTFKSISQQKYGTDRYAQALYLFNRSHPLAEDGLLQNDTLKPKQAVYLPPVEILQSRYPGAGGEAKGAAGPGVAVGSTSQRPSAPAPRSYRVAAGGEKLYDLATRLLGDGNRWVEIRDMNPGWNPELPIPAGTTLHLPGDARVSQ